MGGWGFSAHNDNNDYNNEDLVLHFGAVTGYLNVTVTQAAFFRYENVCVFLFLFMTNVFIFSKIFPSFVGSVFSKFFEFKGTSLKCW